MTLVSARAWLSIHAPDLPIIEVEASTATVDLAAEALGVEPSRIAKTLAIRVRDEIFLVVARGDARLDNAKSKAGFGGRPRMLGPEETFALTGIRSAASARSGLRLRYRSIATCHSGISTLSIPLRDRSTARSR